MGGHEGLTPKSTPLGLQPLFPKVEYLYVNSMEDLKFTPFDDTPIQLTPYKSHSNAQLRVIPPTNL